MKLYSSLSRNIEPFTPQGPTIGVYVCGITPYDTTHLGHLFTYSSFDVLVRYLEFLGHQVRYVQNVTDIDDDILRKAKQVTTTGAPGQSLDKRFIHDMQAANIRRLTISTGNRRHLADVPHCPETDEAGLAYESAGSVYFDVDAWPSFGG